MGIIDTFLSRKLTIVDLDGSEKTWIGGVYLPLMWRGDDGSYEFVRCISKNDAVGKQTREITLKDSNGSYPSRYWTNLPIFWDTHAVVSEAPETIWEYKHYHDVFANEAIVDEWLSEDADGYWDDGFTEWGDGEFEEKCNEYVESHKEKCREIPFEEWHKQPVLTREEWLNKDYD